MPSTLRVAKARSTPLAKRQIKDIWRYIAKDSSKAADNVVAQLRARIAIAAGSPAIGISRPEIGEARRLLVVGSYLVIYEPEPTGIVVLAVVHGMREPKSWLD